MKTMRILAVVCALFALATAPAFAQDKAEVEKQLVGKWNIKEKVGEAEVEATIEFTKDGKLQMKVKSPMGDVALDGTYKVVDKDTLELTVSVMGQSKTDKAKVKVNKDVLELTGSMDNKTQKFNRVKDSGKDK